MEIEKAIGRDTLYKFVGSAVTEILKISLKIMNVNSQSFY